MTGLLATEPRPVDLPALAEAALWQELELTPKPGLVDRLNNGAHHDMDHALFVRSITAIAPWLSRFTELGSDYADQPAGEQLRLLRPMGIACEQAMYAATGGGVICSKKPMRRTSVDESGSTGASMSEIFAFIVCRKSSALSRSAC